MKEQFVNYDIALKLKELGFNKRCFAYYFENKVFHLGGRLGTIDDIVIDRKYVEDICQHKDSCLAPLWQQVLEWFRKKHNIEASIQFDDNNIKYYYFIHTNIKDCYSNRICSLNNAKDRVFDTYEEARKAAILEAIKLISK